MKQTKEKNQIELAEKLLKYLKEISEAKEKNLLSETEYSLLIKIKNAILEEMITQGGEYTVVPTVEDKDFSTGYFVSSLNYLTPPYSIHEHQYRINEEIKLIEYYYTDVNGLKYREVIFPDKYQDPGFLLDNSILDIRENNMKYLFEKRKKEENLHENGNQ